MPGYAYPVEAAAGQGVTSGSLKSISFSVNETENPTQFYTATTKTKVLSVLANNTLGTILPVKLYVYRDATESEFLTSEVRVLNHKYLVQQLVSGDARVDDSQDQVLDRYKVAADFVLNIGDKLMATCPIVDAVILTVSLEEGI
jgi:hypothetical protein